MLRYNYFVPLNLSSKGLGFLPFSWNPGNLNITEQLLALLPTIPSSQLEQEIQNESQIKREQTQNSGALSN